MPFGTSDYPKSTRIQIGGHEVYGDSTLITASMSRSKESEAVCKRRSVTVRERIVEKNYVVTREEECRWRGRRRRLGGLCRGADYTRGRDGDLRFLLLLCIVFSQQE